MLVFNQSGWYLYRFCFNVICRGLPVERYSRLQTLIAYWGFGLYWGNVVSQNAKAHIVGHVKDIRHDVNNVGGS